MSVLRKLRNAFAHRAESASLNDDSRRMRLAAVYADAPTNPLWGPLEAVLAAQPPSPHAPLDDVPRDYILLITILVAFLEVAAGRNWTLAKAAQLIRNDARPHIWVALELNKCAWGLFWASGGLQRCRELLAERGGESEACSALVPATPEALLRLVLDLEPEAQSAPRRGPWRSAATSQTGISRTGPDPWKLVAWASLDWMTVLGITVAGFLGAS